MHPEWMRNEVVIWWVFSRRSYVTVDSKYKGAGRIADYLLQAYGEDAFALLVDEGGDILIMHAVIFTVFTIYKVSTPTPEAILSFTVLSSHCLL